MIHLLNWLISTLASAVAGFLSLLPSSPFSWSLGDLQTYWGYVTYFIPIASIITQVSVYVSAVLVWYGIRWVLRAFKYI